MSCLIKDGRFISFNIKFIKIEINQIGMHEIYIFPVLILSTYEIVQSTKNPNI